MTIGLAVFPGRFFVTPAAGKKWNDRRCRRREIDRMFVSALFSNSEISFLVWRETDRMPLERTCRHAFQSADGTRTRS
jgi:hypothetical protein